MRQIAAFGKRISSTDRGNHRAGDDRPDAGNAHQPFATGIPARDGFNLAGQAIDPLIEPAPVAGQALNHPHHAWRQDFWGVPRMRGSSARKNRCPCRTAMPRSSRKARI